MLKYRILVLFGIVVFFGCNPSKESKKEQNEDIEAVKVEKVPENRFYQYSIWWAFVNKVFEGNLTAKELKTKGDIGLGSYNLLDGELVMSDGKLYKIEADGTVVHPSDSTKVVYANAAYFRPELEFEISDVKDFDNLLAKVKEELPNKNIFYAFKITGDFDYVKCGGLHEQKRPFNEGLDVLIPNRPTFERESFNGTIVGFYCPKFIGNINVTGFHFHFISSDEEFGGHLMEMKAQKLTVAVTPLSKYSFDLPTTPDFYNVGFDKEFQYSTK